jgi:hypothetical protein
MQLKIISDTRNHISKKLNYKDLIRGIILKISKMRVGVSSITKEDIGLSTVRKIRKKKREEKKKGSLYSIINKI